MSKFSLATGWIVNRRWLSALAIAVISAIALGGYLAPAEVVQWFKSFVERPDEDENQDGRWLPPAAQSEDDYVPPPVVETIQVSGFDALLVVESDSFFTPAGVETIRAVVDRLQQLEYVEDILWVDEVPTLNLFGLNEPLLPKKESAPERFENAKQKAREHPLVNGQFLSEDGKTMVLLISIDYLFVPSDSVFIEGIRKAAEEEAANYPVEMKFWLTGNAPVYLNVMRAHEANQLKYQAIAYGLILILSMILFRGVIAVGVVALAPVFGTFWTLGFIRYFEFQMNPFNDAVLPILVALIGFTDGVHLMVQIRTERSEGLGPFAAAKEGLRKVGLACFLTSLTTAVGFGSLALAQRELVREFGICAVIGVTLTFIAVILTIPLFCSTWLGQRIHKGHGDGFIDKNIGRIGGIVDFVLKNRKVVSVAGIAISLTCFLISLTLEPDERQADILPRNSEPAVALIKLDEAMGGLESAKVVIEWNRDVTEQGPEEILTLLKEVDDLLSKEELIGHPISLFNLVAALPGDGKIEDRASMLELLPPQLKRSYYWPEDRMASVQFRVQDLGVAKYAPVFERIKAGMEKIKMDHPDFRYRLEGRPIRRWINIYQIVVDLVKSLGTAALIIFVILAIVYRSLRIGIISILPNLFPLCVGGTYLALTGQALEIVTVCAFTCCLGIAVDDTIHFLTRYVEEKNKRKADGSGEDDAEAIRRAFTSVGTALVMTTFVLVSGFLTVLFSEAREHRLFASMGAITVGAALFGDLVFLPAILARYAGKKEKQP